MAFSVEEASSSNSSKSNSTPKRNFDVFLSFRGEDTRKGFTDHLYAGLCRQGLKTFRDDEELERGEAISVELLKAIEESLSSVVVISKNYAFSSWCLDELQKILASKNELGREVLPIFYGVDPSDLRHQKGSFAEAFTMHEEKFKNDQEKVQKWRNSLTEVSNLSGWDSKDWYESKIIEKVIEELWTKLHRKLPSYNDALIGINRRVDKMNSHLGLGSNDVRFLGLWGMGGIGKTTLARVIYERHKSTFDLVCFLANVREDSQKHGLVHLQGKILSLLKIRNMEFGDTYDGRNIILNVFCNKKVLLVLDDVSLISQLQNLAESKEWFGPGSRVIITTRDEHLLTSHGVHENEIHEVELLNEEESRQLFSNKAFGRDQPLEGYLDLTRSVVHYAGGLPLALEVLGSSLFGRGVPEWEDALDKLKKVPNNDILTKLRISFDALDDEERTLFLDIACFFDTWDWDKDEIIQILRSCDLHPTMGIRILFEKSLLIEHKYRIEMHDLVREMGRHIVIQESPKFAGKRSRLWDWKDINHVLKNNIGTEVTQGLLLPYNFETKGDDAYWDPDAFSKMCNLQLLIVRRSLNLPYGLKCLPSALKVLHWDGYPLRALPLGTQLDELVYLKMQGSKIKQLWKGTQHLKRLKFIDLSYSEHLIETPDFTGVPNIERLILEGCRYLVKIHPSLGDLKSLVEVNLNGCKNLKALPRKLEMTSLKEFDLEETGIKEVPASLGLLSSIEVLNLGGCKKLKVLPEKLEMNSLKEFDLENTGIKEVPASLGLLSSIEVLNLRGCKKLKVLPEKLEMNSLKDFHLSSSQIEKLPMAVGLLTGLKVLNLRGCRRLKVLPEKLEMNSLKGFVLNGCTQVKNLPEFGENMKNIVTLDVAETGIAKLPMSLGLLTGLKFFNVGGCKNLEVLPEKLEMNSLKDFVLSGCTKVKSLPAFGENMKNLVTLNVMETGVAKLPKSLGLLTGLKFLNLRNCKNLVCLPHLHNLKHLKILDISGCSKFCKLPEYLNENEALEMLDATGTAIKELPDSIGHLEKLRTLSFPKGIILPASIFNLKSLEELDLSYCNIGDGFIPDDLSGLSSLRTLDLSGNMFVNLPAGCCSNLLQLQTLRLNFCPRLQSLPLPPPGNFERIDAQECASIRPLSNEQFLQLFASTVQCGRDQSFSVPKTIYAWSTTRFSVTIKGSEIPSWFENQNSLSLNERYEGTIIIDVPTPHEWLGFVFCILLDDDRFYSTEASKRKVSSVLNYSFSYASNGEMKNIGHKRVCLDEGLRINSPHLYIVLGPIFSISPYNQFHLKFKADSYIWKGSKKLDVKDSIKCGWRVIHR